MLPGFIKTEAIAAAMLYKLVIFLSLSHLNPVYSSCLLLVKGMAIGPGVLGENNSVASLSRKIFKNLDLSYQCSSCLARFVVICFLYLYILAIATLLYSTMEVDLSGHILTCCK